MKTALCLMALGSIATIGTIYYLNNEQMVNKKIKKMMKQNEKTLCWIKDHLEI